MRLFLLDTDTLTLAQFGNAAVDGHLAGHSASSIAIPVIGFQEQTRGWLSRLPRLTTPTQQNDWYDRLVYRMLPVWRRYAMLSFTEAAILQFEYLRSLKLNVGSMDLRIAAIALESTATVVTRNLRDFRRVPGLASVDWSV